MYGLRSFGVVVCRILLCGGHLDFSCWSLFCFVVALVHISLWSPKWTLVTQVPLLQVLLLAIGLVIWCLKLYIQKIMLPPLSPIFTHPTCIDINTNIIKTQPYNSIHT